MNLIFTHLSFENFMSFQSAELSLADNDFTLIQGKNNSAIDGASSNGSGKSTIFEAIYWCLTGNTIRGSKDVVNKQFDDKGCFVTLEFILDGKSIVLTRSKNHYIHKTNLSIQVDGKEISGKGIRDSQKIFEETFPELSADLIGSVIILGQGLPQRFTSNTPSGRKQVLEQLTNSDFMIEDLKLRVSSREGDLNQSIKNLELEQARMVGNKDALERSKQSLIQQKDSSNRIELENKLDELQKQSVKINQEINEVSNTVADLAALSHDAYVQVTELNGRKMQLDNELIKSKSTITSNHNAVRVSLLSKKKSLEDYINHAKSVKDVCPTCGQKLQGVEKIDYTQQEEELNDVNNKIRFDQDSESNEIQNVSSEYQGLIKELDDKILDINQSTYTLNADKLKAETRNKYLVSEAQNIQNQIRSIELELAKQTVDYQAEIDKIDSELSQLTTLLETNQITRDVLNQRLEVVKKFSTYLKRDFRGYLLQQYIDFLNSIAKTYSTKLFGSDDVKIFLDGNNLSIDFASKEYESLSGGEKQKVDILVQFAIRELLKKTLDFSTNILALDEITDSLDEEGCKKLINFIYTSFTDLNSVYLISHRKDLNIPYDTVITVEKDENCISRLL